MFSAAIRVLTVLAVTVAAARAPAASSAAGRSAPSRPAPTVAVATKMIGATEHVSVAGLASRLGLELAWVVRGRKLTLTGPGARAEIEGDTREVTVNGVRVFLGSPVVASGGQLYVTRIDFERCLTPMLRPGHGVTALSIPKTIVLDPGHGGRDQGTSVHEKTFALDVAKRAKTILQAGGYRVVLTRDRDTYLTLAQRSAFANANKADLFVSIHFNALANNTRTSGFEIYTFPPQSQRSTKSWSPGEPNDAEKTAAPGNRFDHWNIALAHAIHRRFVGDLKTFDRGKKLMHLGVLRGLNCPGVLVECGFLTSEVESRKIATAAYRQKIAETLAAGVRDYARTLQGLRPGAATKK